MKNFLKKAGALLCASAIIAVCYPRVGNSTALAETLSANDAVKTKINDVSETGEAARPQSGAPDADAAAEHFTATAYALRGRTKSGSFVRRGVIAADPRVLPLGTRVQITAGAWSGVYLVADTGGVIKGRIVDVWIPSNREARQFGRRKVTLKILGG